jgi:ABC-type lipoprotein release transport system permease subunit
MVFNSLSFWLSTASRFLFRSKRSTAMLALMVVAAVSSLIFLSALAVGVNDAMIRNSVALYSGHITGFSLPGSIPATALAGRGVASVLKRVSIPGIISCGERHEGISMMGVDPDEERKSTVLWKKTIQGKYLSRVEKSVFLSETLADSLGVQVGQTVEFQPAARAPSSFPLRVSGMYRTGVDSLDHGIAFCPLGAIPPEKNTWFAAVFLERGTEPESIITDYHRVFPEGDFKSWKELMPDLVQLIDLNYASMGIVMVLVFGIVALGIACIFIIFILKNLREYGIMKAMGVTSREMILLIFSEVFLVNVGACLLGIGLGVLAVAFFSAAGIDLTAFTSHNRYFAVSGVIFPRLTAYSLFLPPVLAMLFSLASAVWPVALLMRKDAADIMRMI